jgi:hypothetical protein
MPSAERRGVRHDWTRSKLGLISRRRILYWLAAALVVFVVGLIVGLIWADTSDVAGSIAGVTTIGGGLGIVALLIALVVVTRRQRGCSRRPADRAG